jgi:hypothetical protein
MTRQLHAFQPSAAEMQTGTGSFFGLKEQVKVAWPRRLPTILYLIFIDPLSQIYPTGISCC